MRGQAEGDLNDGDRRDAVRRWLTGEALIECTASPVCPSLVTESGWEIAPNTGDRSVATLTVGC